MVVHAHGMGSKPESDGHPDDIIEPGAYRDYIYPNDRPATLWYHDHSMHDVLPTYIGAERLLSDWG
jgi:FtsP/CotA-like multicopper oxidase with cupredoxin domain